VGGGDVDVGMEGEAAISALLEDGVGVLKPRGMVEISRCVLRRWFVRRGRTGPDGAGAPSLSAPGTACRCDALSHASRAL